MVVGRGEGEKAKGFEGFEGGSSSRSVTRINLTLFQTPAALAEKK